MTFRAQPPAQRAILAVAAVVALIATSCGDDSSTADDSSSDSGDAPSTASAVSAETSTSDSAPATDSADTTGAAPSSDAPETTAGEADPWRIGVEAPLSGDQVTIGLSIENGAELAISEVNDDGGVLGRQLELVPIDDAADPETGVEAVDAAIADGLDGVIGPYNSQVGVETLPMYVDAGLVPMRLTSDAATDGLGFTLQPMAGQIEPVVSSAITDYLEAASVAIVFDDSQNFTMNAAAELRDLLEAAGVTVTAFETLVPGANDYTDVVDDLAAGDPDLIYGEVYAPEGALIAQAIQGADLAGACMLGYASYDVGYIDSAGPESAGACRVVGVPSPDDFPDADRFVQAFEDLYDDAPTTWAPYAYDSVKLLADAATEAGGFDAAGIEEFLGSVDGWEGWTGTVSLDPETGNRDPATVSITIVDMDTGTFTVDPDWASAVGQDSSE